VSERLTLGISPCPNDTFAFAGLLEGAVHCQGALLELCFDDVERWNQRLARGEIDAAKGSFHAALRLSRELAVLSAGAALGFGVGPLLLGRPGVEPLLSRAGPPGQESARLEPGARVLCPGEWTTATLLFRLFHGAPAGTGAPGPRQVAFSEIMPALERGDADFGVCIHEGRFTWRERGLELIEDLGLRWERRFECPLPLGGILFAKRRGEDLARRVTTAIEQSLAWARANPQRALVHMRRHAQELADPVLWAHVELYVNAQTLCLSTGARAALATLSREAARLGLTDRDAPGLEIYGRARAQRILHALPPRDADRLCAPGGTWRPDSLAAEGFIHLSFEHQLLATLERHFPPKGELALVEVDGDRAGRELTHECSRGGELFPHLRRELRAGDVLRRGRARHDGSGWVQDWGPA
jgi:1,4-dihydroxy-6-naphthoate synthase